MWRRTSAFRAPCSTPHHRHRQGIADIPLFSGIGYRFVCWVILTIVGIVFVLIYANWVKKHPTSSVVYEDDAYWRNPDSDVIATANDERSEACGGKQSNLTQTWIVYALVAALLAFCALRFPMTAMQVGNSTATLPLLPIGAGLFALIGFFALRKGTPYFILTLLFGTVYYLIVGVLG
jgi:Predicted membrane protein